MDVGLPCTSKSKTYNVIDLQNASNRFRSQVNDGESHEKGLDHIVIQNVSNGSLLNIEPSILVSFSMKLPQLSDNVDSTHPSILSQCEWNHFQSISKSSTQEKMKII